MVVGLSSFQFFLLLTCHAYKALSYMPMPSAPGKKNHAPRCQWPPFLGKKNLGPGQWQGGEDSRRGCPSQTSLLPPSDPPPPPLLIHPCPPPPPSTPPPQTKVTIVGKNEIYNREKLSGPFLVHRVLGPRPPPLLSSNASL